MTGDFEEDFLSGDFEDLFLEEAAFLSTVVEVAVFFLTGDLEPGLVCPSLPFLLCDWDSGADLAAGRFCGD